MHDKIFSQIWSPIISQINDIDTICFSPNGILHSIAIEHINIIGGSSIGEAFKIYRLSSTRELVINKRENKLTEAAIYGGLDYDNIENRVLTNNIESSNVSFLWNIGQKKYLKGTSVEYNNILKSILQLEGIRVFGYTGINGTEKSFRDLSNSKPNLIHLATHGFYNTIDDVKQWNMDFNISQHQLSLLRSGLMLSGANQSSKDKTHFEENDGVLTSQEISELNFSHTDLVVLSACESGLGDVTNDGVWGLQRGFKKAGVNSIIMTLWEIDDIATSLFMSEFYRKFMNGYDKYSSLISAQKYVKYYSNEYSNPYYWAGFVLLDGLN
jgi:CHAT domain-containing protein